jgi:hypothetical protein
VRYAQWYLLLLAVLGIYCSAEGSRLERLSMLDLDGVLIQAVGAAFSAGVAFHTTRPLFNGAKSRALTCS